MRASVLNRLGSSRSLRYEAQANVRQRRSGSRVGNEHRGSTSASVSALFFQETLMNAILKTALAVAGMAVAAQAAAQITFYEREGFAGRSFTAEKEIRNFERYGFNHRASSVVVLGDRWEVCEDARFGGRCVVLRPGRYPSLAAMGLNDRVSSVRAVSRNARIGDNRNAPAPAAYDYNR